MRINGVTEKERKETTRRARSKPRDLPSPSLGSALDSRHLGGGRGANQELLITNHPRS